MGHCICAFQSCTCLVFTHRNYGTMRQQLRPRPHRLALLGRHLLDGIVPVDDAQDVEQLALVLVDALHLQCRHFTLCTVRIAYWWRGSSFDLMAVVQLGASVWSALPAQQQGECTRAATSARPPPQPYANRPTHMRALSFTAHLDGAPCHLHVQQRVRRACHAGELADLGHGLGLGRPLHLAPLRLELGVARVLAQALARTRCVADSTALLLSARTEIRMADMLPAK